MGYERNDRGYGERGGGDYGRDRYGARDQENRGGTSYGYGYGGTGGRDYRGDRFNDRGDYGRQRGHDDGDRGFFERAGDEVRSWFGDDEAERRRREDERRYEQSYGREQDRYGSNRAGSNYGGSSYGSSGASWRDAGQSNDRSFRGSSDWGQDRNERHDPSYRSWRDRQMESFDRDYEDYRRENQSRFDQEFHSWRQGRQGQRDLLSKVKEHAEVVGSDGQHVGTVDHVRSDSLLLTKSDQAAGGRHHSIPSSWLQSVDDDGKVTLSKTADQARQQWRDEQRNQQDGGLFGQSEGQQSSSTFNRAFGER